MTKRKKPPNNGQGDLFGGGGERGDGKKPRKPREPREAAHEWTDPITGEVHRCPKSYMELVHYLGPGEKNALHARFLLHKMGKRSDGSRLRHLRKAIFILQREGVPIVSLRSSRGGYYIASTREELEQHCEIQCKLAHSMLAGADLMRDTWTRDHP